MTEPNAKPRPALSVIDAAAIIVGIVVGGGIFKLPSLVAGNVIGDGTFILLWLAGGLVTLVGAMTYAELAATYPDAGGDYHYLTRAYGRGVGFLFAWARLAVIQTGSIALAAFLFGDYATNLLPLGPHSSSIYAMLAVVVFTGLNIAGVSQGKGTQNLLTGAVILGLLMVIVVGILRIGMPSEGATAVAASNENAIGRAMVFVLLTYGGWNEAAYLSAEMRGGRRSIVGALLLGVVVITALYVLANLAFLRGLGLAGMADTPTVAADLFERSIGSGGAVIISLIIIAAALSTLNGTVITGARTNYALGRDFSLFGLLGRWEGRGSTPVNALLVQGGIALILVLLGTIRRGGFAAMVDYTAPVFWLFFLLVGVALFVLRYREPLIQRPFRVPLYPLTPLIFCAACVYMLWASLAYVRVWSLVGVGVLAIGMPLFWLATRRKESSFIGGGVPVEGGAPDA